MADAATLRSLEAETGVGVGLEWGTSVRFRTDRVQPSKKLLCIVYLRQWFNVEPYNRVNSVMKKNLTPALFFE